MNGKLGFDDIDRRSIRKAQQRFFLRLAMPWVVAAALVAEYAVVGGL